MSITDTVEQIKQRVIETQAAFKRAQLVNVIQTLAIEAMRRSGQCYGGQFWQEEMHTLLQQTGLSGFVSDQDIHHIIQR